jgi:N-alpha-acetyltransferase 38, NatC auxiliary subunit
LALHFQRGVAVTVKIKRVHADIFCQLMRDTEAIRNLKSVLRGTLRVIINDNRAFVGTFVGTDKNLNILLLDTEEFRLTLDAGENTAGRYVGQVMIPWRIIQSIGLQFGETNA